MATDSERQALVERARAWVRVYECSFPFDLHAEMLGAGMDAGRIEEQLLKENDSGKGQKKF